MEKDSRKVGDRLQNSRFFLKISQEIGKAWRTSLTFCLTARAYLNTQKYGLFCSLGRGELSVSDFGECQSYRAIIWIFQRP